MGRKPMNPKLPDSGPVDILGMYRHYKGGEYEVLGIALHSETHEELILYRPVRTSKEGPKASFWVRPKEMFFEKVIVDGNPVARFALMS
jgi:hypothetical protein